MIRHLIGIICTACLTITQLNAEKLVILHTNDTHSHIDAPEGNGLGGVLRRKALIDSVRAVEPNVMLVDAGDIVQGTLYFHVYKGEIEQTILNELGYDIQILGNHEFDNGMEALAKMYSIATPALLSTNYDLTGSLIGQYFSPYTIRTYGGKRIGIIAINLDPKGMIAEGNYDGVKYLDAVTAANSTAWHLKHNEKVDAVIAITHIGYKRTVDDDPVMDCDIAGASTDIDIIIGGHTHTKIDPQDATSPAWKVANASGDSVLIAQTGKYGQYLGEITLDLDNMTASSRLIPVDKRLDNHRDPALSAFIDKYRQGVNALYNINIGYASRDLDNTGAPLLNFVSDFIFDRGSELADSVELAISNKGGLRQSWPKGNISEGQVIDMMPFQNKIVVLDIKGSDLLDALNIMAARGGDGVSDSVRAVYDPATHKCSAVEINGKALDTERTYRMATIDYLAKGGDYMEPLTRGTIIAKSKNVAYDDMISYLRHGKKHGKTINPPGDIRMSPTR